MKVNAELIDRAGKTQELLLKRPVLLPRVVFCTDCGGSGFREDTNITCLKCRASGINIIKPGYRD